MCMSSSLKDYLQSFFNNNNNKHKSNEGNPFF